MQKKLLKILCDPKTGKKLQITIIQKEGDNILTGILYAKGSKSFYPIINGIPRLLVGYKNHLFNIQFSSQIKKIIKNKSQQKISLSEQKNIATFSQHWLKIHSFDKNGFSVWGVSGKQIIEDVLRIFSIKANSWNDKLVLDAGCGHGIASIALLKSGADVIAMDITKGVDQCKQYVTQKKIDKKNKLHLIQASIEHPCFNPEVFDAIYSNGVLHHTPSTKASFLKLSKLLKPNGKFYIWLYIKPKDLYSKIVYGINTVIRNFLRPFGPKGVLVFSKYWVHLMQLYHKSRKAIGLGDPYYLKLSLQDHLLEIYDHFAVRYDWHHTYEEVYNWYEEENYFFRPTLGINTTPDYKNHGVSVIGIKQ